MSDVSLSGNESDLAKEEPEDGNEYDSGPVGNAGWADAMAKVLRSKSVKENRVKILAKAKKEAEVKLKETKNEFEIIKDDGQVVATECETKTKKSLEDDQCKAAEKRRKREEWENLCRHKPSVLEKDRERALMRVATKGVVQLFNAVRQQQKTLEVKVKSAGASEVKREKVLESLTKGQFLDMLKASPAQKKAAAKEGSKAADAAPEKPVEEHWNILRDDFMMDASIKDWDKD